MRLTRTKGEGDSPNDAPLTTPVLKHALCARSTNLRTRTATATFVLAITKWGLWGEKSEELKHKRS